MQTKEPSRSLARGTGSDAGGRATGTWFQDHAKDRPALLRGYNPRSPTRCGGCTRGQVRGRRGEMLTNPQI